VERFRLSNSFEVQTPGFHLSSERPEKNPVSSGKTTFQGSISLGTGVILGIGHWALGIF
jgi:hypothetical protein